MAGILSFVCAVGGMLVTIFCVGGILMPGSFALDLGRMMSIVLIVMATAEIARSAHATLSSVQ